MLVGCEQLKLDLHEIPHVPQAMSPKRVKDAAVVMTEKILGWRCEFLILSSVFTPRVKDGDIAGQAWQNCGEVPPHNWLVPTIGWRTFRIFFTLFCSEVLEREEEAVQVAGSPVGLLLTIGWRRVSVGVGEVCFGGPKVPPKKRRQLDGTHVERLLERQLLTC